MILVLALKFQFVGPKHFPFLALLPPEVWADIVVEVGVVNHSHGMHCVAHFCFAPGCCHGDAWAQAVAGIIEDEIVFYYAELSNHRSGSDFQLGLAQQKIEHKFLA